MTKIQDMKNFLAKEYGTKAVSFKKIKDGVINSNYFVAVDGGEYLFKIYSWRKPEEVSFEMSILDRLSKKKFPSPAILKDKKGNFFSVFEGRPAVLLSYSVGVPLDKWSADSLYQIGLLLAKMHTILRRHGQCVEKDCRLSPPPEQFGEFLKKEVCKTNEARNFFDFISGEFDKIKLPQNLPISITHQDIKPDNVIVDKDGSMTFIDFDNSYRGPMLHDLTTVVMWTCFDNKAWLRSDYLLSFLNGYESERQLTGNEKKYFTNALLFRLLREAFAWGPTRFNSRQAKKNREKFLSAYKNLKNTKVL